MSTAHQQSAEDRIEAESRRKYSGGFYQPEAIMRRDPSQKYFARLDKIKLRLVLEYATGKRVLDLCCATADRLWEIQETIARGVGLDFSPAFLERARSVQGRRGAEKLAFLCGNARNLPFADASFGLVYCFSSLYYIPRVDEVLMEIGRVLEPGGFAVLELGNLHSLNTLVARAHPETAAPCHVSVGEMRRALRAAGLTIREGRAFQLLPLWGNKPYWMRPLLSLRSQRVMGKKIMGRMLDEWLCGLPIVSRFAFRHVFVCRK